jgi:hypothetical protein
MMTNCQVHQCNLANCLQFYWFDSQNSRCTYNSHWANNNCNYNSHSINNDCQHDSFVAVNNHSATLAWSHPKYNPPPHPILLTKQLAFKKTTTIERISNQLTISTRMNMTYSLAHENMVEAMKKGVKC